MNKILFTLCNIVMALNVSAQTTEYYGIRDVGLKNLRAGDFASAKSRFELMEPYVDDSHKEEYNALLCQLQDSINNTYDRANTLREKKQYELAIVEYQRLIGRGKEPLIKPLYAYIGYCYEMCSNKDLARSNYQLGIQHNENVSALRKTWDIRENKNKISDSIKESRPAPSSSNGGYTPSGWDDFVDAFTPKDQTWGLGYSYSQYFPLTLSANYTYSCLSVAAELGVNLDGKKYTANQYNPSGYITISPGFYCRFLSFNCGVGVMAMGYTKTTTWGDNYTENFGGESEDSSVSVDGSVNITTGGSISTSANKYHFVLKPSITGYIPISREDYYITINAGYNYIPKSKELNGWSFGVGFQWVIW